MENLYILLFVIVILAIPILSIVGIIILLRMNTGKVKIVAAPSATGATTPTGTGAPAPTPTGTTTPSKKMPTWGKGLLATAVVLIIIYWGGEILSALKGWDWSTTSLGKAIDGATGPGWSNLLWLFLLVPLYFLVGLPKGLAKNAGTLLSWGVAIIGVIGLVWFFTQDPLRWWHNDNNIIRVNLNMIDITTISLIPGKTLIIEKRNPRVAGECFYPHWEPTREWRNRYGIYDAESAMLLVSDGKYKSYIFIMEPLLSRLKNSNLPLDILVENKKC